jgi:hypothetical protein
MEEEYKSKNNTVEVEIESRSLVKSVEDGTMEAIRIERYKTSRSREKMELIVKIEKDGSATKRVRWLPASASCVICGIAPANEAEKCAHHCWQSHRPSASADRHRHHIRGTKQHGGLGRRDRVAPRGAFQSTQVSYK